LSRKVLLRADGNAKIGMGHFSRTLALAEMLKNNFDCCFYTKEPTEYQRNSLEETGLAWYPLKANQSYFNEFAGFLKGNETVILDNYYFSTDNQHTIKSLGCKLICIDDLHDKHFYSDIVINHAPGINKNAYSHEDYTELLLGMDYSLINKVFERPESYVNTAEKQFDIAIMFGGTNSNSFIKKVLMSVDLETYRTVVVSGAKLDLTDLEGNLGNIKILENISHKEVSNIMFNSRVGILPASTTSIEAVSVRLPFLCGYFIENQADIYNGLINAGAAIGIGNINNISTSKLKVAIYQILKRETQLGVIENQRKIHDKKSPQRLIKAVEDLTS